MKRQAAIMEDKGFTLVELLIALAIGGIVMGSVMTSFQAQHKTYLAQDYVVEMRQNARVAMDMMVRDLRMAGYDPQNLGAGITTAGANQIEFTRPSTRRNSTPLAIGGPERLFQNISPAVDNATGSWQTNDRVIAEAVGAPNTFMTGTVLGITNSGQSVRLSILNVQGSGTYSSWTLTNLDRLETVRYMLYNAFGGPLGLGRARSDNPANLTNQPIAENIPGLAFRYLDADGNGTAALNAVRSIQVAILAQASADDPGFNNNQTYSPWAGINWGPFNDGRRRLMLTQTVLCRNLGLEL